MDGSRPGFVAPSDPIPRIATAVRFFSSIRFSVPAETRAAMNLQRAASTMRGQSNTWRVR